MIGGDSGAQAFWLTHGVARAMGLNLTDAMAAGRLRRGEFDSVVSRCRSCAFAEACTVWLTEATGGQRAGPAFCPNLPVLSALS